MNTVFLHSFQPGAFLEISGLDAFAFLQSQGTADLRPCTDHKAVYTLWLNTAARVVGDSWVWKGQGGCFFLYSATTPARVLMDRLQRYIIADDVEVVNRSDSLRGCAVFPANCETAKAIERVLAPDEGAVVSLEGGVKVLKVRRQLVSAWDFLFPALAENGEDLEGITRRAEALFQKMLPEDNLVIKTADADQIRFWRYQAGIPEVPSEIGESEYPQEGGSLGEAVSFSKGCYLGQEIMAGLQRTGRVPRRLLSFYLPGDRPCGSDILDDARQIVGSVKGLAFDSAAECSVGLALVKSKTLERRSDLFIGDRIIRTSNELSSIQTFTRV